VAKHHFFEHGASSPLEFLTKLMPDSESPGEEIARRADAMARDLGQYVARKIDNGQLRVVCVSALTGDLRRSVERAIGPLPQSAVIVVAERQD
jgi:hypothetical protein